MNSVQPVWDSARIVGARPPKNQLDPLQPYAFFIEQERSASGRLDDVAVLLLTNRECPFRCLMCDLWKNTLDVPTPRGAIPAQIDFALSRLPQAQSIKLYNNGNFFDAKAIPTADHKAIAERVQPFSTVLVENHPKLCSDKCFEFRDSLAGELEIALGLETVHPQVLPALNKEMTTGDYRRAAELLHSGGIRTRAFILLQPPFLPPERAVEWAVKSVEFAFACGTECCTIIPTRAGNGAMEIIQRGGMFSPPRLSQIEAALEAALALGGGRVFVDLWDAEKYAECPLCGPARIERLAAINRTQQVLPRVECACGSGG